MSSSPVVLITPDIIVHNAGTLFSFRPVSPRAKTWIDEHVQGECQWFGHALIVERRYAQTLTKGMQDCKTPGWCWHESPSNPLTAAAKSPSETPHRGVRLAENRHSDSDARHARVANVRTADCVTTLRLSETPTLAMAGDYDPDQDATLAIMAQPLFGGRNDH